MRRRARVDANHGDVREALRKVGWTVVDMSGVGDGFPDLLAIKHGRTLYVEVKDGAKVKSKQKLTADEVRVHALLTNAGAQVVIVTSIQEAVNL
jgi:Holliday junction resolvase